MSIKIMSRVWETSKQGGSQLLLLLAIADNANDEGFAWPGQEYLAKKIRMGKTSIPRLTKKLNKAGELLVVDRSRQGKSTQYVVLTGMTNSQLTNTLKNNLYYSDNEILGVLRWRGGDIKLEAPQDEGVTTAMERGVTTAMERGVTTAMETEPSLTPKETSFLQNSQKLSSSNEQTNEHQDFPPEKKASLNKLAPIINEQANGDIPTEDALREVTLLGYEVAQVCKLDVAMASPANLKALARVTIALNTKRIAVDDLKSFSSWWYDYSWQGKKGQAPTPGQLGDNWGQYEASQQMKSANSNGPILTPEQKAQLDYFIAQDAQK